MGTSWGVFAWKEFKDARKVRIKVSTQKPVHEEAKPEFVVYPSNP